MIRPGNSIPGNWFQILNKMTHKSNYHGVYLDRWVPSRLCALRFPIATFYLYSWFRHGWPHKLSPESERIPGPVVNVLRYYPSSIISWTVSLRLYSSSAARPIREMPPTVMMKIDQKLPMWILFISWVMFALPAASQRMMPMLCQPLERVNVRVSSSL